MALKFNQEYMDSWPANLAELAEEQSKIHLTKGDWRALREFFTVGFAGTKKYAPKFDDVQSQIFDMETKDGATIKLQWFTNKENDCDGAAVVYAHGGGLISGNVEFYEEIISHYVSISGVPFLGVDYRLAPENKGATSAEDVFEAIQWVVSNAETLGVDVNRIAVMGDSGGGAAAAGAAILARNNGVYLAKQILIYAMLDDRDLLDPDSELVPVVGPMYDQIYTCWKAVLGDEVGCENISPIIVPGRNEDFTNLAEAYIDVGEMDIFRNQNVEYAKKMWTAGRSVELHVRQGLPHGFDMTLPPTATIVKQAFEDRVRVLKSL